MNISFARVLEVQQVFKFEDSLEFVKLTETYGEYQTKWQVVPKPYETRRRDNSNTFNGSLAGKEVCLLDLIMKRVWWRGINKARTFGPHIFVSNKQDRGYTHTYTTMYTTHTHTRS